MAVPNESLERIALCPGAFDPITEGHIDIIRRASEMFGRIIVAVAESADKKLLFSLAERVQMAKEACRDLPNVEVDGFQGLVVEYAQQRGAIAMIKGLRAVSDFEREVQMALMNRRQAPHIHTVFLVAHSDYTFLSSSLVKELAALGGDVKELVPAAVLEPLYEKLKDPSAQAN